MMEKNEIDVLTARVQELEQQLQLRQDMLDETNKDLHTFTYKVSHDLHAPLRAINTYIQMLRVEYGSKALDEEALRMISRVQNNVEEMKKMLDSLLAYIRTGKKELIIQSLDMNAIVKEICSVMQQTYPDRKIVFHVKELPDAEGDKELIAAAWTQLISNAVKFTAAVPEANLEISAGTTKDEIIYAIKDNGDGFDMSFYPKLFGVFQRLHHKTDFEGAGIGLAIVHKIMDRHKGKVWAEAKVKDGATFYFSLPLKKH